MKNGITINGVQHAIRQTSNPKDDECKRCSLKRKCSELPMRPCEIFRDFGKVAYFVKVENKN